MYPYLPSKTNIDTIKNLIEQGTPESRAIEYKKELPNLNDKAKKDILNSITALANTNGGMLIYGVAAKDGIPEKIVGIEKNTIDGAKLTITSCIQTLTTPPITQYEIKEVDTSDENKSILIIFLAKSANGPHAVKSAGKLSYSVYARNDAGKYPLDYMQITQQILQTKSVYDLLKTHHREKVQKIFSDIEPINLIAGSKIILTLSPLDQSHTLNPKTFQDEALQCSLLYTTPRNSLFNIDGLLVIGAPTRYNSVFSYNLFYRNGGIESVASIAGSEDEIFPATATKRKIKATLESFLKFQQSHLPGQSVLQISFIHVEGKRIPGNEIWEDLNENKGFDRPIIHLPEAIVPTNISDINEVLNPLFDILWQAAGLPSQPDCHQI